MQRPIQSEKLGIIKAVFRIMLIFLRSWVDAPSPLNHKNFLFEDAHSLKSPLRKSSPVSSARSSRWLVCSLYWEILKSSGSSQFKISSLFGTENQKSAILDMPIFQFGDNCLLLHMLCSFRRRVGSLLQPWCGLYPVWYYGARGIWSDHDLRVYLIISQENS